LIFHDGAAFLAGARRTMFGQLADVTNSTRLRTGLQNAQK
jgi:hypothetical protein